MKWKTNTSVTAQIRVEKIITGWWRSRTVRLMAPAKDGGVQFIELHEGDTLHLELKVNAEKNT